MRREYQSEHPIGKFIEQAAAEAGDRLARAVQGPPPTDAEAEILAGAPHEQAHLYTHVLVTDLETGEQERYHLVREGEGDLTAGQISISSPLGRALLLEYPGAIVAVKSPAGRRLYRLLKVEK
jgi:transcription elongation GreA/GreB family factor